jgi:hypothetical protein
MQLFISWSGEKGRVVAEALRDWIRVALQGVDPFISTRVEKGDQWLPAITRQLDKSRASIVVVTRDSLDSRWLHFEAGALSKVVETADSDVDSPNTVVWTYLVDVAPTDVEYPLAQFQHSLSNPTDTLALMESINRANRRAGGRALADEEVRKVFDVWWPQLGAILQELERIEVETVPTLTPARPDRELLEEVLELVRGLHNRQVIVEITNRSVQGVIAEKQSESFSNTSLGKLLLARSQRERKVLNECWVHFISLSTEGAEAFVDGVRALFGTAVVRDVEEGKGRYSLNIITVDHIDQDAVLEAASRAGVEVTMIAGEHLSRQPEERE